LVLFFFYLFLFILFFFIIFFLFVGKVCRSYWSASWKRWRRWSRWNFSCCSSSWCFHFPVIGVEFYSGAFHAAVSRRLPQQRHKLHGVYNGTIPLQIYFDSTPVRLLIKGH